MYDNIGSKIKTLAQVVFIIMAVISIISGIIIIFSDDGAFIIGILTAGIGVLLSWIGTFFLYGFGQLIENTDILVRESKKQSNDIQRISTDNNSNSTNTTGGASTFTQTNFKPAQATPTTHTINFTQSPTTATNFKRCPRCGERVTSKSCDVCGTENNLF